MPDSVLYFGDNLDVLRKHIPSASVDLIYLDPPFNSNRAFNVIFEDHDSDDTGSAQISAFEDTWRWDHSAEAAYAEVVEGSHQDFARLMVSFRAFLGESNMMAYLAMMAPRLLELHRVLKETGSLYLHCDPTASHYLKLSLDAVFGPEKFVSEIIWKRSTTHSDAKRWSPVHDTILYYARGKNPTWHPQHLPHSDEYVAEKYKYQDADGRKYTLDNMTSPNPRPNMMYEWKGHTSPPNGWRYSRETMAELEAEGRIWYPNDKSKRPRLKRYLDEMPGVLMTTVWTDISPINSQAQERLGYPTQKPEALLERIIRSSSNEGDVVLDPFCGCGTTVAAAEKLNRRWIGIDITHLAINLIRTRLRDMTGGMAEFRVIGEPVDLAGAQALAAEDKFQFQWWALGLVGARPVNEKKGADRGVDGRLFFDESGKGKYNQVVLQVKGGKTEVKDVRDLRGVLDREKAALAVLISLNEPTAQMRSEAASAGLYDTRWGKYPRIQILTIAEILDGKRVQYPAITGSNKTLKAAPRVKEEDVQLGVFKK